MNDTINPKHYKSHPSGIECIEITEHMNFNCGNAVKYIWRAEMKGGVEDMRKAAWYIAREIARLEKDLIEIPDPDLTNLTRRKGRKSGD